jgi:hypothetical protein
MRIPSKRRQARKAKLKSFPAPNGGWIANSNLAQPDARLNGERVIGASMLENWFPTATGTSMRGGSNKYATVGAGTPVKQLITYSAGGNEKLFAATAAAIYDITTVANPAVSPAAAVSGLTGGEWSFVQFSTSGGDFLRGVNGVDTPRVFDGTTWGTTPALTGMTAANLSFVWSYAERLFFIEKDSLSVWYLAVESIGGSLTEFPMGGIFNLGGSLLFGATWSIESGDGPAARCVIVTTEGEVAVYDGIDPASATLAGVYKIGRPLGKNAFFRGGGDLIIATDLGLVPLSVAVQRDLAALAPSAISYPIETEWNDAVALRTDPWHCEVWPTKQMVAVALPTGSTADPRWYVANARTGAWASYTGWDASCVRVFGDRMFFGTPTGTVIEAEVTGADQGTPYTATCVPMFDDCKTPLSLKTAGLGRAVYKAPRAVNERLSLQTDYELSLPTAPDSVADPASGNVWGTGIWGTSVWGASVEKSTFQKWRSVSGAGSALAPGIQITSGSVPPPAVDLVRIDLTYDECDPIT